MGFENIKENEQPGLQQGFEGDDIDLDSDELSQLQTVRATKRPVRHTPEMKTGMKRDRMGRRGYADEDDSSEGADLIAPDRPIRIAGGRRPVGEQRTQPFTSEHSEYGELFESSDAEHRPSDRGRFSRLDGLAYDERQDGDGAQFEHIFSDRSATPFVRHGENMVQELMRERRMEEEEQQRQLRGLSGSRPTGLVQERAPREEKRERAKFSRRERKREEPSVVTAPPPAVERPAEPKKDAAMGKGKRSEGKRMDKNNTQGGIRPEIDAGNAQGHGQAMPQMPYGAPAPYGYPQPPYGYAPPPYGYAYPQPPYPYAPPYPYGYAYPQPPYPYAPPYPYGYAYPQPPYGYPQMPGMMPGDMPYNPEANENIPDIPMLGEAPAATAEYPEEIKKPEAAPVVPQPVKPEEPKAAQPATTPAQPVTTPAQPATTPAQPATTPTTAEPKPEPAEQSVSPAQPASEQPVASAAPPADNAAGGRFNRRSRGGSEPAAAPAAAPDAIPEAEDINAQLSALSRRSEGESYSDSNPRFTPRRRNAPLTAEDLSSPAARLASEDDDIGASLSRMNRRNRSGAPD